MQALLSSDTYVRDAAAVVWNEHTICMQRRHTLILITIRLGAVLDWAQEWGGLYDNTGYKPGATPGRFWPLR